MRRNLILLILAFAPFSLWAQSYEVLWKQVDEAGKDDLPKTQIATLGKIADKAGKAGDYGQLLAARLMAVGLQTAVSPDSADVEIARLETLAEQAEAKDPVLAAVYQTVLGRIYNLRSTRGGGGEGKGRVWFRKAMSRPALLARHKASEYTPLVSENKDSEIFGDDLLHVIGMESGDYETLYNYYEDTGNRPAACIIASLWKDDIVELDSLLDVYGDLPEAGELAKKRYSVMSKDASAEEKVKYIDYAVGKWKGWELIGTLVNERRKLTKPTFSAKFEYMVNIPERECNVALTDIRNISEIVMRVSLLDVNGDAEAVQNKDYDKLVGLVKTRDVFVQTRTYTGHEDYESLSDSMTVKGLPVGVYLVEFHADGKRLDNSLRLYHVTDLYAMAAALPDDKVRCAVVYATTGQPVPGATLKLVPYRTGETYEFTVGSNGEVVVNDGIFGKPYYKYVYTDTDRACPAMTIRSYYSYSENKDSRKVLNVYTDRSLYRPGQDVHVAVVVYNSKGDLETSVVPDEDVQVCLRDANHEKIAAKTVTTDRYGTANVDFTIPQNGLAGKFSVEAVCGQTGRVYIHVEEYKRPTFYIEFPEYKERYAAGDTVTVKAYAKTYAGMPVQGAKVEYAVDRRRAFWCRWPGAGLSDDNVFAGETVTDEEGAFEMRMPLVMPDKDKYDDGIVARRGLFFNFTADVKITDTGGESHSGWFGLPLGTKPTSLSCDLPDKILGDSLKQITFSYTNAAGKPMEGRVSFTLGGKVYKNRLANTPVDVGTLKSGRYSLFAVCGNDTVEQDVVVFSTEDKRPVIETDDWFYVSAEEFPSDGWPVYVQVGSSAVGQHIVYNVFSGKNVLESGVIDQSNALHNRAFVYKNEYGDGITITYAWVKDGRMYSHKASVKKTLPDKRLLLEWKTFRDRLVPGQEEEWTLLARRPDGKAADALLIASMYDKSLDDIYVCNWNVGLGLYRNVPYANWRNAGFGSIYAKYSADIETLSVRNLVFDRFDNKYFDAFGYSGSFYPVVITRKNDMVRVRGISALNAKSAATETDMEAASVGTVYDAQEKGLAGDAVGWDDEGKNVAGDGTFDFSKVQLRENFNETAFFYPNLATDANGSVNIKFRLPESVTTWKFIGYAHDKDMNNGFITGEAVARKTVMVSPDMPRFVRINDKPRISARLFNLSENSVTGRARMELVDPETDAVVYSETKDYIINAGGTSNVSFSVDVIAVLESILDPKSPAFGSPLSVSMLVCRITAAGDGYSDGEQHYLPVLPGIETVTNTVPFTQNGAGTKEIDLAGLCSQYSAADLSPLELTIEYTDNPAWMMIQALPYVGDADEGNAISLASAFYANSLAANMLDSLPEIRRVFAQWGMEKGDETSLMSNLQKDRNLKELVLGETPWVAAAKSEEEQRRSLVQFFNGNNISNRLSSALKGLGTLQNEDGSWSWWNGMNGSPWMTVSVCRILARLNHLVGVRTEADEMLRKGLEYLSETVKKEVTELKDAEKKGSKDLCPGDLAINYLYIRSLDNRKLINDDTQDMSYLIRLLSRNTSKLTIYGKAKAAVILAKNGYVAKAKTFLESLKEYSVCTEEKGRYFDTRKAYYSMFNYRIPTEVAAIEALRMVTPQDTKTVEEMQRWLLQEKRTQAWDTPVNSVDAVYAFFCGSDAVGGKLFGDKLVSESHAVLKLDGKAIEFPKATVGMGYVKTTVPAAGTKTFTVEKTSDGTSWGAVYVQSVQPVADIDDAASGINVKREVFIVTGRQTGKDDKNSGDAASPRVGDKVKVVITVTADRDYDFVQVTDKRAACLEPVAQLSGYRYGYYCVPKDNTTNYYFDHMAKGRHVIETEYYVERAGEYATGTCTAQCAYAPEYMGRAKADKFDIDGKD